MKIWMAIVTTIAMWIMFALGYGTGKNVAGKEANTILEAARAEDLEMCRATVLKIERQLAQECMEWCETRAVFAPDDTEVRR